MNDYNQAMQRAQEQLEAAQQHATTAATFAIGFIIAFYAFLAIWTLMLLICSYSCLKNLRGTARTAWLIAIIAIPFFGWIFYLILSGRETETAEAQTPEPTGVFPRPEDYRPSEQETADRIRDALAGRNRA